MSDYEQNAWATLRGALEKKSPVEREEFKSALQMFSTSAAGEAREIPMHMLDDETKELIEFLDDVWKDQKAMQETINVEREQFKNEQGDEFECWKLHEANMIKVEKIMKRLRSMY